MTAGWPLWASGAALIALLWTALTLNLPTLTIVAAIDRDHGRTGSIAVSQLAMEAAAAAIHASQGQPA